MASEKQALTQNLRPPDSETLKEFGINDCFHNCHKGAPSCWPVWDYEPERLFGSISRILIGRTVLSGSDGKQAAGRRFRYSTTSVKRSPPIFIPADRGLAAAAYFCAIAHRSVDLPTQ
jgi:hypothetical protein